MMYFQRQMHFQLFTFFKYLLQFFCLLPSGKIRKVCWTRYRYQFEDIIVMMLYVQKQILLIKCFFFFFLWTVTWQAAPTPLPDIEWERKAYYFCSFQASLFRNMLKYGFILELSKEVFRSVYWWKPLTIDPRQKKKK